MGDIELSGVRKYYRSRGGRTAAVDGLDLVVEAGTVHGFLGPNGSGKTTTIRMLLGLIRPDAGEVRVLGARVPGELPAVVREVGSLVETPFFPHFSGRTNLRLLADVGGVGPARVEECLELVGLRERAADPYKRYSMGMKQRLGVAAALLTRPRLLVLDEPTNGLDPAGMREVRELVRGLGSGALGAEPTTVFLSSHLLGEVAQVCDHVSIVASGRCVASGRVADVLAGHGTDDVAVSLAPDQVATGAAVLAGAGLQTTSAPGGFVVHGVPEPALVTRLLADAGCYVSGLTRVGPDLESVFLELTREQGEAS